MFACKSVRLDEEDKEVSHKLETVAKDEVAILRKLRHQHIASVLFAFTDKDAEMYNTFILPVADCNLRQSLEGCVKLEYSTAVLNPIFQWFGRILDALNHAHRQQIKHRDIKPTNFLIKDKAPYLADFGLAKDFSENEASFTEESLIKGTHQYLAPEHQLDQKVGRGADIFALGCVFSEMLTVCNYKSLKDYRSWRRTPEGARGSSAFRESLPKVRDCLDRIEKGHLNDLLAHQTLCMLDKEPKERPAAQHCIDTLS